jgi:hypothetical protein
LARIPQGLVEMWLRRTRKRSLAAMVNKSLDGFPAWSRHQVGGLTTRLRKILRKLPQFSLRPLV